jgi:uncharacterized linocin/CFP29 family protein
MQAAATVNSLDQFRTTSPQHSVPRRFIDSGLNTNSLRTNALLRKDEWINLDTAIVDVARRNLNGIADLQGAGLTRNLGGLGTLIAEWEQAGDMSPANIDMSAETRGSEDTQGFNIQGVPVPVTHKDYRIDIRRLEASRRLGSSLDVSQSALAARIVSESLEDTLFNGVNIVMQGRSIHGYTTLPNRSTGTLKGPWTNASTRDVIADMRNMIAAARLQNYFGPFPLYVNNTYWTSLQEDYKAESDKTIRDRILDFSEISSIRPSSSLASNEIVMIQMTSDVVQLGVAQDITNVEWSEMGGMVAHFKVMAAIVPILKWDANNQSGIIHYSE